MLSGARPKQGIGVEKRGNGRGTGCGWGGGHSNKLGYGSWRGQNKTARRCRRAVVFSLLCAGYGTSQPPTGFHALICALPLVATAVQMALKPLKAGLKV